MDPLIAPKSGIVLLGAPSADAKSSKPDTKSTQAMRLDLAEGMFSELLKSVRSGGKGLHVSFGKTPVSVPTIVSSLAVNAAANIIAVHRHSTTGTRRKSSLSHLQPLVKNSTAILQTETANSTSPAGSAITSERRR